MPIFGGDGSQGVFVERVRALGWGSNDSRVRATWRVLFAMPLLWVLTGGILAGNLQAAIGVIPASGSRGSGVAQSLLHTGFFLVALALWARYLDRESLSNYGVSVSRGWGRDVIVSFAAVVVGSWMWTGLNSILGGTTLVVAISVPQGSVLVGLVFPFVALVLHAAVQQIVFFRVILKTTAEGVHSRGVTPGKAAIGSIPVAVLLFILMHGEVTPLRALDLAVAGTIFGLLYLHTGELALGIGAHFGALYGGTLASAVFEENGSLSGLLGVLDQYGFSAMIIGYVMIIAWLLLWRGELQIQSDIARSTGK